MLLGTSVCVAPSERFELPTYGVETRCSNPLSYEGRVISISLFFGWKQCIKACGVSSVDHHLTQAKSKLRPDVLDIFFLAPQVILVGFNGNDVAPTTNNADVGKHMQVCGGAINISGDEIKVLIVRRSERIVYDDSFFFLELIVYLYSATIAHLSNLMFGDMDSKSRR